jgi:hypothetical protein
MKPPLILCPPLLYDIYSRRAPFELSQGRFQPPSGPTRSNRCDEVNALFIAETSRFLSVFHCSSPCQINFTMSFGEFDDKSDASSSFEEPDSESYVEILNVERQTKFITSRNACSRGRRL